MTKLPSLTGADIKSMLNPTPWLCPTPNIGLSVSLKNHDYDGFIRAFSNEVREMGKVDVENITMVCEGQCPKGCGKKFKLKLSKSITKKSFEKLYNHGKKYPEHCMTTKWDGVING